MTRRNSGEDGRNEHRDFRRRRVIESTMQEEAKALFASMPLRHIYWKDSGSPRCVLECGHPFQGDSIVVEEDQVRCLECYKEMMLQAEMLLER